MLNTTSESGGFEKVVFESVIDTLAGGTSLDTTGYDDTPNPGYIPAGTPVTAKDGTTGLSAIVEHTTGTLSATPIGYVYRDTKLEASGNTIVAVVIEGVVRKAAIPAYYTTAAKTNLATALPKITHV